MLGLPIISWMRFFVFGSIAGLLLCFMPLLPVSMLGVLVVILGLAGVLVTAVYTRSFLPWTWRRWLVRARRVRQALYAEPG